MFPFKNLQSADNCDRCSRSGSDLPKAFIQPQSACHGPKEEKRPLRKKRPRGGHFCPLLSKSRTMTSARFWHEVNEISKTLKLDSPDPQTSQGWPFHPAVWSRRQAGTLDRELRLLALNG